MDWDDFKFVQAVAQTGSVRRAGEVLGVHGSTVARRLDQLERRVGTRLFARTARGMEMTAAGGQIIELLDRVAAELDQVERSLQSRGSLLTGPVALAAPPALTRIMLIPALDELYRQHPDIEVALPRGPALEILERGQADLALWMTDDPPEDLIGRPLATVMACAYATPACADAVADEPSEGAGRWVGPADPTSLSARVRMRHFPELSLGLAVDDVGLVLAALEAGLGVGLLPCHLGDGNGHLVRAGALEPVRLGDVWLFIRPDARGVARIQAVSAFLQEVFSRHRASLEGHGDVKESAA